jgi:type VI secretion system protein ImpF
MKRPRWPKRPNHEEAVLPAEGLARAWIFGVARLVFPVGLPLPQSKDRSFLSMADAITPLDRLQPCLLDRLTDDEPGKREESRSQRIVSLQRYKAGVLRDLDWLFNSIGHFPDERVGEVTFADYEEAYRSVINFGIRQLYGRLAPDIEEIEKQLLDALITFEPRINRRTLKVEVKIERNILSIELTGELWVNPLPEKLFIKTELDLESSECSTKEGSHG